MKKLFKKSVISGAIIALGIVVGFAASTALQDLDAIRDNFDYILNLNTSKQTEIDGLNTKITDLEGQITELKQAQENSYNQEDIDALNTTIDNLNAEIDKLKKTQNNSGKQEQIDKLEKQVETLEAERDKLKTEYDALEAEYDSLVTERDGLITQRDTLKTERDNAIDYNTELENKITELRDYTNGFVNEDEGVTN